MKPITIYTIRNGGFGKNDIERPKELTEGTVVVYKGDSIATLTKGKRYKVQHHFCFLNTIGPKSNRMPIWDQFYTLKNDNGWTVKVSARKFTIEGEAEPIAAYIEREVKAT